MLTPACIVISGASRGFGLAAAKELSRAYPHAPMHLMASSVASLDPVVSSMRVQHAGRIQAHGVDLAALAMGDATGCTELLDCLSQLPRGQKVLFVHSAAVLGPTGALEKQGPNFAAAGEVVQVNVSGSLALTTLISSCFAGGLQDLHCVNVSSKSAVKPGEFPEVDVYSITKAAAAHMFASLGTRGARVLQYCPGPMKTGLTGELHDLDWPWVQPEDSARALVALIKEDSYRNNACLDFLDDHLALRPAAACELELPETPPRESSPSLPLQPPTVAVAAAVPLRKCMITRIEAFCSSHTLENCSWCEAKNKETFGKCNRLHGHNYKAEFSFSGFIDPETGMVANLSDLKLILQAFLDRLDHSHLNDHQDIFKGAPTTAEVISQVLFEEVGKKVSERGLPTELVRVKLWETDKNIAEYPFSG